MLNFAKENITKAGLTDRIILVHSDAKQIPLDENFFDVSFCAHLLHHQKNPEIILQEMARVTKNNGFLILQDFLRPPFKFLLNFYSNVFGFLSSKLMKKQYYDSLAASLTFNEVKNMLRTLRMRQVGKKAFPHSFTIVIENKKWKTL